MKGEGNQSPFHQEYRENLRIHYYNPIQMFLLECSIGLFLLELLNLGKIGLETLS